MIHRTARRQNSRSRRKVDSQTLQLHDNVLAIVAHDLRTPLNTIVMAAELIGEMDTDERRDHFLDLIINAAGQADSLIRDLIDVARVEDGRFRIDYSVELLSYLLTSVTETFAPFADRARVLLVCNTDKVDGLKVRVDSSRFVQLLSNILSNAVKFTPAGGNVVVDATVAGDVVRIEVHDSGVGITADELPHVFERFWQADHHRRAGAGLGMAIAKGIVEAHGGEIGVTSEVGVGSTFYFTLPLHTDRATGGSQN